MTGQGLGKMLLWPAAGTFLLYFILGQPYQIFGFRSGAVEALIVFGLMLSSTPLIAAGNNF